MLRTILIFITVLSLYGCAAGREIYLTEDVLVIDAEALDQYWVTRQDNVSFNTRSVKYKQARCGHVVLQYLIDSNGIVFDARIVESEPAGFYDEAALRSLSLFEYVPAAGNPQRTPVQVTKRTEFKVADQACP